MTTKPLTGIRVADLSRVLAGPWAGQALADLGAEVIKVERPGTGDESRTYGPIYLKATDGSDTHETASFLAANRSKKSITADLSTPEGQEIVRRLVAQCDVLIENYKVGDLARRGLGYEDLRKVNPNLIYCSITGFGQTGPYRQRPGYDPIAQAMSGFMSTTGIADGEPGAGPMKAGPSIIDLATGLYAVIGIQGALFQRFVRGGGGEYIDMSLLDCGVAFTSHFAMQYVISGKQPPRVGTQGVSGMPGGVFACGDGHIMIAAGPERMFPKFCAVIGRDDLPTDPRFLNNGLRIENRAALLEVLGQELPKWKAADLYEALNAAGVPASPVNTIAQAFVDPQVEAREMIRTIPHPRAGEVNLLANPIRYSTMTTNDHTAPPEIGEHADEILTGLLGYSADEVAALRAKGCI